MRKQKQIEKHVVKLHEQGLFNGQLPFIEFMKRNIFVPVGMTQTRICNRRLSDPRIKDYAYGYVYDEDSEDYLLPDELEDYSSVV